MSLVVTTVLFTAAAALIHALAYAVPFVRKKSMDIFVAIFFIPLLAALNTLWMSLLTVPLAMFLLGSWGWPFADWPLLIQIGVVVPFLVTLPFGMITLILDWDKDLSPDRYNYKGQGVRPRTLAISSSVWRIGFTWMLSIAPLVALASLLAGGDFWWVAAWGIVAYIPFSAVIIADVLIPSSRLLDHYGEMALAAIFTLWFPLHIAAALVLVSPFFLLLVIPIALLLLALGSDGHGGGYNSGPVISWFISR